MSRRTVNINTPAVGALWPVARVREMLITTLSSVILRRDRLDGRLLGFDFPLLLAFPLCEEGLQNDHLPYGNK